VDAIERIKQDRLLRYSAYVAVPVVWLSVALLNVWLLLVLPITAFGLMKAMEYGMIDRHDPADDLDFL
jgi:hypothetical protein